MNRSNQTLTAIDQAVKVSEQLPCELKFFVQQDLLLVTCGTLTLSLKGGHPASTFSMPWLERVDELDISCAMNSEVLRHAIKEIHYAAADDEARPVFTAICLSIKAHQMDVIATDA